MAIQELHRRSLAVSSALMEYYVDRAILPSEVIAVLDKAKIKFMLVGAHGVGGWMNKPRASEDVDVVVSARHVKKAVRVLVEAFPDLEAEDLEVVTRLRDRTTKSVMIDVMKPNQPIFRVALANSQIVTGEHVTYRIPTLEMALAMKFASMISLNRQNLDKRQDAVDFCRMVLANPTIDLTKLAELGDYAYPDGGKELLDKVHQAKTGGVLNI